MIPPAVTSIITKFIEVFPKHLPNQLPPIQNIQYAIDLVLGATLPNLRHYRMNLIEHVELQRQVDELLSRGFIRELELLCGPHTIDPYVWIVLLSTKEL